jgi:hypothetical protein
MLGSLSKFDLLGLLGLLLGVSLGALCSLGVDVGGEGAIIKAKPRKIKLVAVEARGAKIRNKVTKTRIANRKTKEKERRILQARTVTSSCPMTRRPESQRTEKSRVAGPKKRGTLKQKTDTAKKPDAPLKDNGVDLVDNKNVDRDHDTSGGTVPDSVGKEGKGRAEVHGVVIDVEGESSDSLLL